jgi:hypothetical protein
MYLFTNGAPRGGMSWRLPGGYRPDPSFSARAVRNRWPAVDFSGLPGAYTPSASPPLSRLADHILREGAQPHTPSAARMSQRTQR